MRNSRILELVKILESHNISEIEVSRWGFRTRVAKSTGKVSEEATAAVVREPGPKNIPSRFVEVAGIAEDHTAVNASNIKGIEIKSPIVGTFYQSPSPDAEPYVKLGDQISIGQPLCIIEAMKIMNVIESEVAGKLVEMAVENAHPVEYNQTLFIIEPTG
jgi:acetyl-CoA carboxylase biotin carboxyl carrier protein